MRWVGVRRTLEEKRSWPCGRGVSQAGGSCSEGMSLGTGVAPEEQGGLHGFIDIRLHGFALRVVGPLELSDAVRQALFLLLLK